VEFILKKLKQPSLIFIGVYVYIHLYKSNRISS
jgi:hypothetical protein